MTHSPTHIFIASASTAALSLSMLVASVASAQESAPDAAAAPAGSSSGAPSQASTPDAAPLQALVTFVSGKARWRPSADAEWKDAAVDDVLSPGAEVRTGMRSRVQLRMKNASVLIDSNSNFALPTIQQEGDVLRTVAAVRSGRADFKVDKVGLQNDFKVVTPSSTLAVRGTEFSTVAGPLKGVEIVGARTNLMRAIEVRYEATSQTVELSGGYEAKSTSDSPLPTENSLGSTFNAPQSGMVASKEEAQQGALAGTSAPQTQRQATTTVASVTQVKQDIQAAADGESGSSTISLVIDIARAASLRAEAESLARSMIGTDANPGPLVLARQAAAAAQASYQHARDKAGEYDQALASARTHAQEKLTEALGALRSAQDATAGAGGSRDGVRQSGLEAFRLFTEQSTSPLPDTTVIESAIDQARASEQAAVAGAGSVAAFAAPDGTIARRSSEIAALAAHLDSLVGQFSAHLAALQSESADTGQRAANVETLQSLVAQAHAAVQSLAAGKSVPQIQQSALLSAQAAVDALARATEAGQLRTAAFAQAAEMLERSSSVLRGAIASEVAAASQAVATVGQLRQLSGDAAAVAQASMAKIDEAIEAMFDARSGHDEAVAARAAAEGFRDLARAREAAAIVQAGIAASAQVFVNDRRSEVLSQLEIANEALRQSEIHGEATSEHARLVYERLLEQNPDYAAARADADSAEDAADRADEQAVVAEGAGGAADHGATLAEGRVADAAFAASETEWTRLVDEPAGDAEVAGADVAATDAGLRAADSSDGATRAGLSGIAEWGGDAAAAVLAAADLAARAQQQADSAQAAFDAAEAALVGARSSAERAVWTAVRNVADDARVKADQALSAAFAARKVAGRALAEASAATAAVDSLHGAQSAQVARVGTDSARDSASESGAQLLAFVDAQRALLESQSSGMAQTLQALGWTLAAAEVADAGQVAQQSAAGVATLLSGVNQQFTAFRTQAEGPEGVTREDVQGILATLLSARNESLALALAGGAGAARSGAEIAQRLASRSGTDAASAQGRADAIAQIIANAAVILGVPQGSIGSDPKFALLLSIAEVAGDWADRAGDQAQLAGSSADGASSSSAAADAALASLGLAPAWATGGVAAETGGSQMGTDVATDVAAAVQSAAFGRDAIIGASALIAFEGAASATASSIDASERGSVQANAALAAATEARDLALMAAADLGSSGEVRTTALADIAGLRSEIEDRQGQASSQVSAASGGLNSLLAALDEGTATRLAAQSILSGVDSASGVALGLGQQAWGFGQDAAGRGASFDASLNSLGITRAQFEQMLADIDAPDGSLASARSDAEGAHADYERIAQHVGQLLAAAQAGESVDIDQLHLGALWLQERAEEDLASVQSAVAGASDARGEASDAIISYVNATSEASEAVLASAQQAASLAESFLAQVQTLRREYEVGARVGEALGARDGADLALSGAIDQAAQVAVTAVDASAAIGQHTAAIHTMLGAVAAATVAQDSANDRLGDLEVARDLADGGLSALVASLGSGNRTAAGTELGTVTSQVSVASAAAADADQARADALAALGGFGTAQASASGALAQMGDVGAEIAAQQIGLALTQSAAEQAGLAAQQATFGLDGLVDAAGTERAEALGGHALSISNEAIARASDAIDQIVQAHESLLALQGNLAAVDITESSALSSQAAGVTQWAEQLGFGSSTLASQESARVAALAEVATSTVGAYDAAFLADSARQAAQDASANAAGAENSARIALDEHRAALVGVNYEHDVAHEQRGVAQGEWVTATLYRIQAGFWFQQTLGHVSKDNAVLAASAAGESGESATGATLASGRADFAAGLAEQARDSAFEWARLDGLAGAAADAAVTLANGQSLAAAGHLSQVGGASSAADAFATAAEQFAAIAATAAAGDASALARQAHDRAVAQIVLAEQARDAAEAAAAGARTHANKIVFGAVAAKANQTANLAAQARDYANQAEQQAAAARADAASAATAAASIAGGPG